MKITNFVMERVKGTGYLDLEYFATVSVTTGALWWKKVERRAVRRKYGSSWHFVDTGEFTPGYVVQSLERAYEAQKAAKEISL